MRISDNMVCAEEITTLCIIRDKRKCASIKKFSVKVRESYTVERLYKDVALQSQYSNFQLLLEPIPATGKHIRLHDSKQKKLSDVGIQFNENNTIIITPLDSNEDKISVETEMSSDDHFALSASDCPTETITYNTPAPPPPPDKPLYSAPMITHEANNDNQQTSLRRVRPAQPAVNFVGLVNQAMTCYLNSLLQALFMTPEFRNALYNWEFDGKDELKSIPYQLQKLFVNLQTSTKSAVETTDLTKSFGWDSAEGWQQHDIQELCRVMFDALEQKFKNTKQSDLINRLYEGKMMDYVKCLECKVENEREDKFLDIPLPVRPFGSTEAYESIEDALRAFVQPEILDGNNQYFCEKCDKKCDAHKGLKFTKFPYILTLHLKRFDFDYQTLHRIKLNDKVTFPQTLNLNNFVNAIPEQVNGSKVNGSAPMETADSFMAKCDECSTTDSGAALEEDTFQNGTSVSSATTTPHDPSTQDDDEGIDMELNGESNKLPTSSFTAPGPYIYELFAIMIHSGSASGGHYYAYIKDFNSLDWFSFNDQTVSSITQDDIQKSFGGGAYKTYYSGAYSSSTNAYMLMYRQTESSKNTLPIKQEEFPEHIQQLVTKIKEDSERKTYARDSDIMKLKVFFDNPKTKQQKEGKIYISYDSTLSETVYEAHRILKMKTIAPLERCRLVGYNSTTNIIERSFDGQDNDEIGNIMKSLEKSLELLLEVRNENETFEEYLPHGIMTKVFKLDVATQDVDGPISVRGIKTNTIMEYKQSVAKKLSWNWKNIAMVSNVHKEETKLLENNDATLLEECFYQYSKIFVAINSPETDFQSKLKHLASRLDHILLLYFVLPNIDAETLTKLSIPKYVAKPHLNGDAAVCNGSEKDSNSEDSSLSDNDRTLVEELQSDDVVDAHINGNANHVHHTNGVKDYTNGVDKDIDDEEDEEAYLLDCKNNDYYSKISLEEYRIPSTTSESDEDTETERMLKVLIDKRATLGYLKYKLQSHVQVPMEYFKIFKSSIVYPTEVTVLKEELSSYKDGEKLTIELGRVLRKGEYKCKVFFLNLADVSDETDNLPVLCNWILRNDACVAQTKRDILAHIATLDNKYTNLSFDKCRLRKKNWKTIAKVFLDDQKFGDDIPLSANFEMILQEVQDLPSVTPNDMDDIVILVRRWYPAKMCLGKFEEVIISDKTEMKNVLSALSGISEENLEYAKIQITSFLRDSVSVLNINSSLTWLSVPGKLANYPLNTSQDGHIFYYRDKTEPEKELTAEERKELSSKEVKSSTTYSPRKERALKIYLDSSPKKVED